jgi:hypothetical protein
MLSDDRAIKITLKRGTKREKATRDQLLDLLRRFDLSRWLFTYDVVIEERSIPHSHPILTLNTRHLDDDRLLLSTFVHEQLHWFLTRRRKATTDAMHALEALFPKMPVHKPEGAGDQQSSLLHVVVNHLEFSAMRELLGEREALEVIEIWAGNHYTGIYRLVLDQDACIADVVTEHGLRP